MSVFTKIKEFPAKGTQSGKDFVLAAKAAREFIAKKGDSYSCQLIFIHNGYAVEYRKLRRVY